MADVADVADDRMSDVTEQADEFAEPFVDVDEWRERPAPHRYVHGGFAGTDTRFSFHLPPAQQYEGRFFQYITPVPDSEHFSEGLTGEEDKISFALESGGCFVETNGGGQASGDPFSGADPTIAAYRANAAAAKHARVVASEMYGEHRAWGYAFGGSGGAFRTIGGAENTTGVWDGVVPFVIGSPLSIPNCFTARMHALRVLRGRWGGIVDALDAGGSGDPYVDLDAEQADALREVTSMGFPPRSWFGHATMGMHALAVLYPGLRAVDPGYFDDFWTVPGYLGADSGSSVHRDRVQLPTRITGLLTAGDLAGAGVGDVPHPGESTGAADDAWLGLGAGGATVAVRLADVPEVDPQAAELIVTTGASAGSRLVVLQLVGDVAVFGPLDPREAAALGEGDEVLLDNSGFLAVQTYHRHQVPGPEFTVWDQFRDEKGRPRYPQRPMLVGPMFAAGAAGTVQTGRFGGRMIVVESLLDREAYPWQADWYRSQVEAHLGHSVDDRFRLWMIDHALHGDFTDQEHPSRTVSYLGVVHQALRDLSAWVERGIEPPATTRYEIVDGQVVVPDTAEQRRGVQPLVHLTADGSEHAEVSVGQEIVLRAEATTPGTGTIVAIEWGEEARGIVTAQPDIASGPAVEVERRVSFASAGTYFPTVRVTAHRDGNRDDRFARLQNLARVRVTVR